MDETGWGAPEHLWVIRRARIDVVEPVLEPGEVELVTWCNGSGALAAGRRMLLVAEHGGRIEFDSVWIHLGPDARPARIEEFTIYAASTGGRLVSTRLELREPSLEVERVPWAVRSTDLDVMGHVNNAVYWQAVEQVLGRGLLDPGLPFRARLDYRHPIDLGEDVELVVEPREACLALAFEVDGRTRAVARLEPLS